MVRNRDRNLRDIVFIVRLRQLVAHARMQGIGKPARFSQRRGKTRIDRDANDVISRRYRRLAIPTVENEILPLELPDIEIRESRTDALVARNSRRSTDRKRRLVVIRPWVRLVLDVVFHAEAALGGAP